jgi:hypothetical protein
MMRISEFEGIESAPRWILLFLGSNLAAGLLGLYLWNATSQVVAIQSIPVGTSWLSVICIAAATLWLCVLVLRSFPAGAPLRPVWFLFTLAAGVRLLPCVAGFLPASAVLVPASGPVQLALLAAGIHRLLGVLRGFGLGHRASTAEWSATGIAILFALCRFGEVAATWFSGRPVGLENWISLLGMPILCLLAFQAMQLVHAALRVGSGLIPRSWLALVGAIVLTGVADVASWVTLHEGQPLALGMIVALLPLPIAAAFALVPAYQIAAQRRATKPVTVERGQAPSRIPELAG